MNKRYCLLRLLGLSLLSVMCLAQTVAAQTLVEAAAAGKAAYQRCAACHLADGVGIPSAFPPLKNRLAVMAADEPGREYLILVVVKGLFGAIEVNGNIYRGAMPAQAYGLDHQGIAALLNQAVVATSPDRDLSPLQAFSAAEVEKVLAANAAIEPAGILAKREAALK